MTKEWDNIRRLHPLSKVAVYIGYVVMLMVLAALIGYGLMSFGLRLAVQSVM